MRVPQKSEAQARYTLLKSTLQGAAQKPGNSAVFKNSGDHVELTQDVRFNLDGVSLIAKKGSHFDNDIKTADKISVETSKDGTTQADSFEHYSEPRGWLFKRDQEMLKVTYADQQGMNFSNMTSTFEI